MELELLHAKFRGCLLGGLLGDCLGFPFETQPAAPQETIDRFFNTYANPNTKEVSGLHYSDDTAMTRTLGWSLVQNDGSLVVREVSVDLADDFYRPHQHDRMYEATAGDVFSKLLSDRSGDPFKPAQDHLDGTGSLGNGAATRISPLALIHHLDAGAMKRAVRDSARITHAHPDAIKGAILQALAVVKALHADPNGTIDAGAFISGLMDDMIKVERPPSTRESDEPTLYVTLLQKADKLLQQGKSLDAKQVVETLGNGDTPPKSVVTSIYCFLRATLTDSGIKGETTVVRAIRCAMELGGQTDTIGSMAGTIAGAYLGESSVPSNLLRHCEKTDDVVHLADELFRIAEGKKPAASAKKK